MLKLVQPASEGQGPRPPGHRHARCLSLTAEEKRHFRAALQNLRRAFGSWACLADAMGVKVSSLMHAAQQRNPKGSAAMALRAARVSGMSVEALLSGELSAAGRCETCGARIGQGGKIGG